MWLNISQMLVTSNSNDLKKPAKVKEAKAKDKKNTVPNKITAEDKPVTKFGGNIGITIIEPRASKTTIAPQWNSVLTWPLRFMLRNVDPNLMITEDKFGVTDGQRQFIMLGRAIRLQPKKSQKEIFNEVLSINEHTFGTSLDYIMGYVKLYDGWDWAKFPKTFVKACEDHKSTPVITIEPYFKRKYVHYDKKTGKLEVMDFLQEYNEQISDKHSKLYKGLDRIAMDEKIHNVMYRILHPGAKSDDTKHRFLHEPNQDLAYPWTMYMCGEKEGPAKYKMAWKRTTEIFAKYGIKDFIFSPVAFSDPENPLLGSSWNRMENIMPGTNVSEIGFDIYQEKPEDSFNVMFADAGRFIQNVKAKNPKMKFSICEASTKPEEYRAEFIRELFTAAKKYAFEFVSWFNEDKEQHWQIDATIESWTRAQTVKMVRDNENTDDLAALYGVSTTPADNNKKKEEPVQQKPEVKAQNYPLMLIRQLLRQDVSGRTNAITVNKDAVNMTPPDVYYKNLFNLEKPKYSYGDAISQWMKLYTRELLRTDINKSIAQDNLPIKTKDPQSRIEDAETYAAMWFAMPSKYVKSKASRTISTKNEVQGRFNKVEYKVVRTDSGKYAVYKGDMKAPVQTVFNAYLLDRKIFSDKDIKFIRGLIKEQKRNIVNYSVRKIKEELKNSDGNVHQIDTYEVFRTGMDKPLVVSKISDIKDAVMKQQGLNPDDMKIFSELWQSAVYFKGEKSIGADGKVTTQKTDLQTALDLLQSTIDDKKSYGTKNYVLSLVAKQELLMKYDMIYLDEAEKIRKGDQDISVNFEAVDEAEKTCYEVLDILDSREYVAYGYRNPQLSDTWVMGLKAQIYVSLGDIYASDGKKAYLQAQKYYKAALDMVNEKEKYSFLKPKEKFLNNAAEIGLERVNGILATANDNTKNMKELDKSVYDLSQKVQLDKKLDPSLIIKAKFYLAELIAKYPNFINDGLTRAEGIRRLRVAYTIFQELKSSELSYRAKIMMEGVNEQGGIMDQDVKLRSME